MHDASNGHRSQRTRALIGFILVTLLVSITLLIFMFRGRSPVRSHPASEILSAGQAAMAEDRFDDALALFERAESQGGALPGQILFDCAQASLHLGKTTAAERYLRNLLQREPDHLGANELLCALLRVAGRNWELRPHALELMRKDVFSPGNLAAITATANDLALKRGPQEEAALETFIFEGAMAQNEAVVRLSRAHYFLGHNLAGSAKPLLAGIVAEDPAQLEAQALLGSLLLSHGSPQEFQDWYRRLPKDPWTHPEMWMVGGAWSEQQGDRGAAARCYWEALRLHPDHLGATYRLSQMLSGLDRKVDSAVCARRASQLSEVQTAVASAWSPPSNVRTLAERLESLGRLWESLGWSIVTIERDPRGDVSWARERAERLRRKIEPASPLVMDTLNPVMKIDLSELPLPDWGRLQRDSANANPTMSAASQLAFVDSAKSAGISFSYYNGADPRGDRAYMFEFSGGGVAVLDYDADGWPDLYLTQGCEWPLNPAQRQYTDRLYRNLANGRFEDVTERAGLFGNGFGQGVSAGDIDNDGLPDLYIANIGRNQLYHNNGDGTFTDITSACGITAAEWTLSTLIADLNSDGYPDLYDVNYLGGPNIFTQVCLREGKPIQCFPNQFPAEEDKVYRNLGDGHFRDVSREAGILVPDGKGMGIVAADFDGSRRLSLFISNDTTANFFFLNQTPTPGGEISFTERALLSGVAFSASGVSASHMGIAAGDANGDDLLDLFVTNFQDEANNLYVQDSSLLFDDRIRQSKLHDPGFLMEGWGAQFMDGDLDGKLDLVVANGHLDNYPHSNGMNLMPTQFFYNVGQGQFAEIPSPQLGPYFEKKYLGRAVALLDWNRDGRPDFCVTHTDAPVALLTNQTRNAGHFLVVHLRGVVSARDAIGTNIALQAGDRSWSQQLIAGDGFQVSNQRIVVIGLGTATQVDELKISWPSGADQTFRNLDADDELLFIEGHAAPVRLLDGQSPKKVVAGG